MWMFVQHLAQALAVFGQGMSVDQTVLDILPLQLVDNFEQPDSPIILSLPPRGNTEMPRDQF